VSATTELRVRPAALLHLLLLLLIAPGCYTSPPPERIAAATSPRGVTGEISVTRRPRVRVELLEVRDSAYVVLVNERVAVVPFRVVSGARFAQLGSYVAQPFSPPAPSVRETLRTMSRFPQGIPPGALAQLLAVAGQQEPDDLSVKPPAP
jgi:hypothetical protein